MKFDDDLVTFDEDNDGLDNDGDLRIDALDAECVSASTNAETTDCADHLDNDGDGFADLADPGCASASDPSEQNPLVACDDGIDDEPYAFPTYKSAEERKVWVHKWWVRPFRFFYRHLPIGIRSRIKRVAT